DLDLTGVKALAHGELERAQGAAYRDRAAHRTRRPVERREKAIARVVDLSPAETGELRTDESVVLCEQRAPSLVADAREELGRSDEVREQDGRQYAVRLRPGSHAGDEFLDLHQDGIRVCPEEDVVASGQLDELRVRDGAGDEAT